MARIQASELLKAPLLNSEGLFNELGTSLLIAPHPDDEALGCGGMIATLRSQGVEVYVIFFTSGDASHPRSIEYPKESLAKLREKEALRACEILGVDKEFVFFFKQADGLVRNLSAGEVVSLQKRFAKIIEDKNIKSVFVPWRRDCHPDHVAVTAILMGTVENMQVQMLEYPIWLWQQGSDADWPKEGEALPFRLDISKHKNVKHSAIYAHQSQTSSAIITDDADGFLLDETLLEPFLGNFEYYFFQKFSRHTLNQEYFNNMYDHNQDPWNFESSPYEKEKYDHSIAALGNRKFKNALEIGCSNGVFSYLLAPLCKKSLGIDISETPLKDARTRCARFEHCTFQKMDISKDFPDGEEYDLIIMSEVGYYLEAKTLIDVFDKMDRALEVSGIILLVHWTAYVRDYPLTGKEVHELFQSKFTQKYHKVYSTSDERYMIDVWKKVP